MKGPVLEAMVNASKALIEALRAEGLGERELIDLLFQIQRKDMMIPVEILGDRRLGALEAITMYMKDQKNLTYHDIAVLLKRDDRTIWATYNKAKKKIGKVKANG
jgi:hypothetical protein